MAKKKEKVEAVFTFCSRSKRKHEWSDNRYKGEMESQMRPVCGWCDKNMTKWPKRRKK